MLAKRIIPCLDVKNGRNVRGVRFSADQDAGDPVELATRYDQEGADELVFYDITSRVCVALSCAVGPLHDRYCT